MQHVYEVYGNKINKREIKGNINDCSFVGQDH